MEIIDAALTTLPEEPEQGIYLNVPAADYFRWPYLSKSGLSKFAISPAQFHAHLRGLISYGKSAALLIGSAVDTLWFDGPEGYRKIFAEEPPGPHLKKNGEPYADWWGSKAGERWKAERTAQKYTVLSRAEADKVKAMVERLNAHEGADGAPSARDLRDAGKAQVSLVWVCPYTGIWCKGRPDLVDFDLLACDDLKTTADSRPKAFSKAISTYDYHWQAYHYTQGLAVLTGTSIHDWIQRYIAIRNEPVHSVEIYRLKQSALLQGKREVLAHMTNYRRCLLADHWPADSGELRPIELAGWRKERSFIE